MGSYITFIKEKKEKNMAKKDFVENEVEINNKLFEEEKNFFSNDAKENENSEKIEDFGQCKILKSEEITKEIEDNVSENNNENQKENIDFFPKVNEFIKSDSITSELEVNSKKRKLPASENVLKIFSKITKT